MTYKGVPVTGGNIAFHSNSGVYSASIDAEGKYTAADLPEGELIVTVETESLNPDKKVPTYGPKSSSSADKRYGQKGAGGPVATAEGAKNNAKMMSPGREGEQQGDHVQYVKIPVKYSEKKNSPLKMTLTSGSQTVDFDLTD